MSDSCGLTKPQQLVEPGEPKPLATFNLTAGDERRLKITKAGRINNLTVVAIVSVALLEIYGLNLDQDQDHSSQGMWEQWYRWDPQGLRDPRLSSLSRHFGTVPNDPKFSTRLRCHNLEFTFMEKEESGQFLDCNIRVRGQNSQSYEIRYNALDCALEFTLCEQPGPFAAVYLVGGAWVKFPNIPGKELCEPVTETLLSPSNSGGWYDLIFSYPWFPHLTTGDRRRQVPHP